MPSPLGHALGGIAASWAVDLLPGTPASRTAGPDESFYRRAGGTLTLTCAGLAVAPDLDLFLSAHRTATHSVTAVAVVTIVAAVVTGWVTRRSKLTRTRVALMCGAAYASHLLFDWLGIDRTPPAGLQMLWPFSPAWFISGIDLFAQTERRRFLSIASVQTNLLAMAWETALLIPLLAALWLIRVKALARLSTQPARGDHPAQQGTRPVL